MDLAKVSCDCPKQFPMPAIIPTSGGEQETTKSSKEGTTVKKKKKKVKPKGEKGERKLKKGTTTKGSKNDVTLAAKNELQQQQQLETLQKEQCLEIDDIDDEGANKIRFRRYGLEDFRLLALLAEGGFGTVYLAKLNRHNAYFAVKFMDKSRIVETNDWDAVLMEKKVMLYGNQNLFICKLFCSFQTTHYLCFAMEFCCGGDLKTLLNREKRFALDKVRFYLVEIICAIRFLHKLGIIYRDLKLDNVMIAANGHIKLVDFGMCLGKIYRKEMQPSDFCGTVEYMAPEVIKAQRYNQSVDYWSLGIVAYEMSVGGYPFTGTDEDELCWFICNLNVIFPRFVQLDLQNLISLLLIKTAEERIGMPDSIHGKLTEHKFFTEIDWQEAENCRLVPPYIPNMKSARDTSHFEMSLTNGQAPFHGIKCNCTNSTVVALDDFEYTNPNMTG